MVEGGHLKYVCHWQLQFACQSREVSCRQVPEFVLYPVQKLNQQIASSRRIAEQTTHARQCACIDLTAFG
jgi:hypothetical protein